MREAIINNSGPWLPWLAPGVLGVLDAVNVIDAVAYPVYTAMLVGAATITTNTFGVRLVGRIISDRIDRIAEAAPVKEAMLMGYRAQAEHCVAHHEVATEELPQAVGDNTERLSRNLHVVRPPAGDIPAARGQACRRKANVGRATVPQQAQSARPS